jgi:GH25 family lysozyme M1 (1,4-beta-N-acetylmuramidase)
MNNPILGIDTWQGQLEISEDVLLANDIKFMFIRLNSTAGGQHKDTGFDKQWAEAKAFCRAPYFVYSPYVSGSVNFLWLQQNMPADAKCVAIDIELANAGYPAATYASEVSKFLSLAKAQWNVVIYTGEAYLPLLSKWDATSDFWWAEYPYDFYNAPVLPKTWDEVRTLLQKYNAPLNATKIPGRLRFWQFSGDRLVLPGNPNKMDVNVYFGTLQNLYDLMGAPNVITEPTDDMSTPHAGMTRYSGKRKDWHFELFKLDRTRFDFEVVHCNPPDTPSNVAKRKNAVLAFPAGDYDRNTFEIQDLCISNSIIVRERVAGAGRPSLMLHADDTFTIEMQGTPMGVKQAFTGIRPLIQNGIINQKLSDTTQAQNTEGHARYMYCLDAQGNLILFVSEGIHPSVTVFDGLTLLEGIQIPKQYGAVIGADGGAGGDAMVVLDGVPLITPENIDPVTGLHFERALPVVFIVKEKNMITGTAQELLGKTVAIYNMPQEATINKTIDTVAPNHVISFLQIVKDIDHPNDQNYLWFDLGNNRFVEYKRPRTDPSVSPVRFNILSLPTTDPAPSPSTTPHTVDVLIDGVNVFHKDLD